jgi:hypothetical protein
MAVDRHGFTIRSDSVRFYTALVSRCNVSAVVDRSPAEPFCRCLVFVASVARFDKAFSGASGTVAWTDLGWIRGYCFPGLELRLRLLGIPVYRFAEST